MTKVTDPVSAITQLKDVGGVVKAYIDTNGDLIVAGTVKPNGGSGVVVTETPEKTEIDSNNLSTGIAAGGLITVNTSTTFNISDGYGYIVNNTNPLAVTVTKVTWSGLTNITPTFLATSEQTLVVINSSGILQNAAINSFPAFDTAFYRTHIVLGVVCHNNRTTIDSTLSTANTVKQTANSVIDLRSAIGCVNIYGNDFYSASGLLLDKTSGRSYFGGIHQHLSDTNPSIITDSALAPVDINYFYQKAGGGFNIETATNNVNPEKWDNGSGTLQNVPANNYTVQRIYFVPEENFVYVSYGKAVYTTLDAARKAVESESVLVTPENLKPFHRCSLIIKQGTTTINTSDAIFAKTDKFGDHVGSHLIQNAQKASEVPLDSAIAGQTNTYASLVNHETRVVTLENEKFGDNYVRLASFSGTVDISPSTSSLIKLSATPTVGPLVTPTLPAGTYRIYGKVVHGGTGSGAPDLTNVNMTSTSSGPVTNTSIVRGYTEIPNNNSTNVMDMNFHINHTLSVSGTISIDVIGTVSSASMRIYQVLIEVWRVS